MRKILLTSLAVILAVSAASAAEITPYMALRGGYNMTNVSNDNDDLDGNGFLVGAAVGLELYNDSTFTIRAEVEYNYIAAYDMGGVDASNNTVLANIFADIETGTPITPYVGLGLGYGWTTIDTNSIAGKYDDSNMAWQLGAGISYAAMDNLMFDLGYRYLNSTSFEMTYPGGSDEFDIASHQIYLGARLAF